VVRTASIVSQRTKKGTRYAVRWRENGKQHWETQPGYGRQAKEIARERCREIEQGRHYTAPPETLGAFLEAWLERFRLRVRESTYKRKREALKALGVLSEGSRMGATALERLSAVPSSPPSESTLDRLSVADLEDALTILAQRAPRQAQIALQTLKQALRSAKARGQRFDEGLLEIPLNRYEGRKPWFLTWEQVTELQSWMPEHVCRIVPIAALTGLREGELFDLRESDLELDKGLMRIRSGKTQAATRSVSLPTMAVQLLREQLLARRHTEGGYVFPAPKGGRWLKDNFLARVFRPAAKRAGLEGIRPHDLRHTYASLMGSAGVDVATIAAQMGHKDGGALLLRRYRHIFPSEAASGAEKLDALVRSSEEERKEEVSDA
jgi:integrase